MKHGKVEKLAYLAEKPPNPDNFICPSSTCDWLIIECYHS